MLSRGVRATTLRLLESLRVEWEEKGKELEARYAAMRALSAAQCQEAITRILAMSIEAVSEFYLDYRMRKAGKCQLHLYMLARDTRHDDDPEMAQAVERVDVAARNHDEALLDLHVAELFGGRVSYGRSELRNKLLFTWEVLGLLKSVTEKHGHVRYRNGADVPVRSPSKLFH